jgi:hypothetical protein
VGAILLIRRVARDYEILAETLIGLHSFTFAILMLAKFVHLVAFAISLRGGCGDGHGGKFKKVSRGVIKRGIGQQGSVMAE